MNVVIAQRSNPHTPQSRSLSLASRLGTLQLTPAIEQLGDFFYDRVQPVAFPKLQLRFCNQQLLTRLGLVIDREGDHTFNDGDLVNYFGHFQGAQPCLAMRYHGHQFGQYNPYLGDGRGFLYGQVYDSSFVRTHQSQPLQPQQRRTQYPGKLYDFGAKGSGPTPHAQGRDGRLSLRGGIQELLAGEVLATLGIATSRCFCFFETGEQISRDCQTVAGALMIRLSRTHLRFGTFEYLNYYDRPDLIQVLLDHIIEYYYPHLIGQSDRYLQFYLELVQRIATLVGDWMAIGFCYGVLNTDNMSIVGEGFDYGSYAFLDTYNPAFTAATFDQTGRYSYRNQPNACRWNLEKLQDPLSHCLPRSAMQTALETFTDVYEHAYQRRLLTKLGLTGSVPAEAQDLIGLTLEFLLRRKVNYGDFFAELARQFTPEWQHAEHEILAHSPLLAHPDDQQALQAWRSLYHRLIGQQPLTALPILQRQLQRENLSRLPTTAVLDSICNAIEHEQNWQPLDQYLAEISHSTLSNSVRRSV